MTWRRASLAGVAVAATLVVSAKARAFCLTTTVNEPDGYEPTVSGCWKPGQTLHWPAAPIGVRVDPRASRNVPFDLVQRVVTDSFAKWSAVSCETPGALQTEPAGHPEFEVGDFGPTLVDISDCTDGTCVRDRLAGAGSIFFRDDGWPYVNGEDTYALTTLTYKVNSGEVIGAFMELNTADHKFVEHGPAPAGAAALDYVVTHEAGHFLGLSHSDQAGAIMFSRYRNTGDASLRDDDRAAICAIRPAAERPDAAGCACGVTPSRAPWGPLALVSAVLLRRRRGRSFPRAARTNAA